MIKWISHRGESSDSPENTLTSFRLAGERGADGVECDLRLTADHQVVVVHDPTTIRMGSDILPIESSTYDELQKITVSGCFEVEYPGERIPLFRETFQYISAGMDYYVELKGDNPALAEAVVEIVTNSNLNSAQLVFISFSKLLISCIKQKLPQCRALWLDKLVRNDRIVTADELLLEISDLGIDGIDGANHPDITPELIRNVKNAGMIFAVWTIDNPYRAARLIDMGVDVITSNCAAKLKKWYAANYHG